MRPLERQDALESFELICCHRRGFAGSSRPLGPTTIADHAADAVGLLDQLGIDRFHVVGHSSGAAIALEMAATEPARVSSLALLEPPYLAGAAGDAFMEVMAPIERYHGGDTAGAVADFFGLIGDAHWRDTIRHHPRRRRPSREERRHQPRDRACGSRRLDIRPRAGRRRHLPGALHPRHGHRTLFVESRRLLHEWFAHCVDADIPGATHLLQMEAPAPVAAALAQFIG